MQTITIEGVESKMAKTGNTKVTLVCKEGKFYFYQKTKDGLSKAFQQFTKFGFKMGDSVQAEVKTESKSFTNEQGKAITYADNWIQYFAEVEGVPVAPRPTFGTEVPTTAEIVPERSFDTNQRIIDLEETIKKMRTAFQNHEDRIKSLETPTVDIPGFEEPLNIEYPEGL